MWSVSLNTIHNNFMDECRLIIHPTGYLASALILRADSFIWNPIESGLFLKLAQVLCEDCVNKPIEPPKLTWHRLNIFKDYSESTIQRQVVILCLNRICHSAPRVWIVPSEEI